MRSGRLELPHHKIRVPKTRASTNSATTAYKDFNSVNEHLKLFFYLDLHFDTLQNKFYKHF